MRNLLNLLVVDGENALIQKAQACWEEAWGVSQSFLRENPEALEVRVIDPASGETLAEVDIRTRPWS